MTQSLNTKQMLEDLYQAGYTYKLQDSDTDEERYNRIIHLYGIFILQPAWQFVAETAWLVYTQRSYRKQVWTKTWK